MTNKGYQVKEYHCPVKRYCQTMDLKDNPKLIKEYIRCHSKPEAWPEIRAGIRSVGILEMEIYILGSRLFMIIETPLDRTSFLIYPDKQNGKSMYPNFRSVYLQAPLQRNGN